MTRHLELGQNTFARSRKLKGLIDEGKICFAGNKKLKIYGTLACSSGKRMKPENRVFFGTENEAIENQYRPCGHCMRAAYLRWKGIEMKMRYLHTLPFQYAKESSADNYSCAAGAVSQSTDNRYPVAE